MRLAVISLSAIFLAVLAMFLVVWPAWNDPQVDFNKGHTAYEDGNYKAAVKWWREAAEQGHAGAQKDLGDMYDEGRGVAQDYKMAMKWYNQAAEQGHAWAQHDLSMKYYTGRGAIKNTRMAYMFYLLALENVEDELLRELIERSATLIESELTAAQIQSAQDDAVDYQAKIDARQ